MPAHSDLGFCGLGKARQKPSIVVVAQATTIGRRLVVQEALSGGVVRETEMGQATALAVLGEGDLDRQAHPPGVRLAVEAVGGNRTERRRVRKAVVSTGQRGWTT